jgi:hypothetical protein
MASISFFDMEQVLRKAGVAVRPYPTAQLNEHAKDLRDEDRRLIASGTAWERELERLYAMYQQDQHLSQHRGFAKDFAAVCDGSGLGPALNLLNDGVLHRYTGFYQATAVAMINLALADKAGEPRPDFLAAVPVASSFCQFVLRDGSFFTDDSAADDRLDGHPYKGVMLAYCGVPVFNAEGEPAGTLCHFDVVVRNVAEVQFARLHAAASMLSLHLK